MPNYATSGKKPMGKQMRFIVTAEFEEADPITFSVMAATASEATAKTITYIDEGTFKLYLSETYSLMPRIWRGGKVNADYIIN